jgi:ABC-type sugar transport system ATPase subunit
MSAAASAGAPSLLELEGVGKSFFGVRVLAGVSLSLGAGRVLSLVGENGAGKSTLLNVLGGVLAPSAGSMRLGGARYAPASPKEAIARGVAFVHQELNLFPNLSVAENLFLDALPTRGTLVDRGTLAARARALLREVGLDASPDALVEDLSPGERQLVEIARALGSDARVVILDEPTTSLTAPEAERLFAIVERLRAQGRSVVYVSHALGDVLRLADDILVLRDGVVVGGGPRAAFDEARLVSLMVGREIDTVFPVRRTAPSGEVALEARGVRAGRRVRGIDLSVRRGEVVGLAGLMGAGRTETLRALFGLDRRDAGEVRVAGRALDPTPRAAIARGVAFVTEDRRQDGLVMEASVADNLALVALPALAAGVHLPPTRVAAAAAGQAGAVSVESATGLSAPARSLSGGNQQKVVLGKWLMAKPAVFLLDEPTRGIDVGAKQQVYRLVADLADSGAAVLVASSEIEELVGLCDRILVMRRGRVVARFVRPGLPPSESEAGGFDREAILRAALGAGEPAGEERP